MLAYSLAGKEYPNISLFNTPEGYNVEILNGAVIIYKGKYLQFELEHGIVNIGDLHLEHEVASNGSHVTMLYAYDGENFVGAVTGVGHKEDLIAALQLLVPVKT